MERWYKGGLRQSVSGFIWLISIAERSNRQNEEIYGVF